MKWLHLHLVSPRCNKKKKQQSPMVLYDTASALKVMHWRQNHTWSQVHHLSQTLLAVQHFFSFLQQQHFYMIFFSGKGWMTLGRKTIESWERPCNHWHVTMICERHSLCQCRISTSFHKRKKKTVKCIQSITKKERKKERKKECGKL